MASSVIEKLTNCIDNHQNFVFTAGAGSGKTYSLIKVLEYTEKVNLDKLKVYNQNIACITYTNAGVDEIISRLPNGSNTNVCTIHEFLWSLVKNFQKELKKELKVYLEERKDEYYSKSVKAKKPEKILEYTERWKKLNQQLLEFKEDIPVTYQDKGNYWNNIISHDVLIKLSMKVLKDKEDYLTLISNQYPYIFIDEYQDTFPDIVQLFAEISKYALIGFFGDPMQKIYDRGIGSLEHLTDNGFVSVYSSSNYRSSEQIVKLLNKIRNDSLVQIANKDIDGDIKFILVQNKEVLNIDDYTKNGFTELRLVHRRIAERNYYLNLFNQFNDNIDVLFNNTENRNYSMIADIIFDFEYEIMVPYKSNKFISLKRNLKKFGIMDINLVDFQEIEILRISGSLIEYCKYLYSKDLYIIEPEMYKSSLFEEINEKIILNEKVDNDYLFNEFENMLKTKNEENIITCHSTKGKEYDKVLAILNTEDWENKYKWIEYLSDTNSMTPYQKTSTENLFYVVCSRAISELTVALIDPEKKLKNYEKIEELFGKENIQII